MADQPYDQMQDTPDLLPPKYPDAVAQLSGADGNAFQIIATVRRALREVRVPADEINRFQDEAMSGDYDALLRTAMEWVTVR